MQSVMANISWAAAALSCLSTVVLKYILYHAVYNVYFHPLAHIPGPKWWSLTAVPYLYTLRSGRFAIRIKQLHSIYGPIIRLSPDEVSVIDAQGWTVAYAYNAGTSFPKSPRWYRPRLNGAYGIMASPPADHGRFRRTFAPAFTDKALSEQEGLIIRHVDTLVQKLRQEAKGGGPTNMTDWLEYASFDIAGDFAFGESFQCLEGNANCAQVRVVQAAMKAFTYAVIPRTLGVEAAWSSLNAILSLRKEKRAVYYKSLSSWTQSRLAEGEKADQNDLMAWVARRTGQGKTLSPAEAENALGDFMIAGTETVASSVIAALYHLLRVPTIKAELESEIRHAFRREEDITVAGVGELKLLNAVINEAMRLCPTLPTALPRIVPEPGAMICGKSIPSGTFVSFSQYAAYHSTHNFSSPEEFIPQRWLAPQEFEVHHADAFQPFSVGMRNCIGKAFGLATVRLLLARLLWNFDMRWSGREWDWEEQNVWFIWEKRDLLVDLRSITAHL